MILRYLFVISVLILSLPTEAKSCRLSERTCTEAGGPRTVDGYTITKDCWRYSLTYTCKDDTYVDSCLGLSSSGNCTKLSSTCTKNSIFNDCEVETSIYRCGNQNSTSADVIELPPEYTITKDDINYSQCNSITENPTCQESSNVCVEGSGSKVINGLTVYKDCWAWKKTYTCKSSNYKDYCKPLEKICQVVKQECVENGADGICNDEKYIYDCDETHDAEGIKLVDSDWRITDDYVDHSQCNDLQNNCYLKNTVCVEPGSTKIINGLPVTKDCWQYEKQYVCGSGNNVSTCNDIDKNKCKLDKKTCVSTNEAGRCTSWAFSYTCTNKGQDTTVTNCSDKITCINGDCFDTGYEPNKEFGQAVAYVNGALQAGVEVNSNTDPNKIDIFTGTKETCSFYAAGSVDCCKDDGWANGSMGGCDDADKRLIERRKLKLVHYVGTYCAQKIPVIGTCIKTSQSYCAYDSMLSRIIQEGARPQLGMSWGSAESPTCSGMTPEQLQDVDFTKISFQEYIDTLTADIPSNDELQQKVIDRVAEMTK
ncbi:conjugal transfer protein TraN [Aeromonas caviae]|uniref:conjugal transfer protein TraN n=1 Tax=Aeromonas caviae TaxID=648 RepID=UPI0029DE421C|nr:conjugal transfer protein TraN [Aeromonas caviae]MDX7789038.1 conjugal transfer protein TraN [Aeromonas caviae]